MLLSRHNAEIQHTKRTLHTYPIRITLDSENLFFLVNVETQYNLMRNKQFIQPSQANVAKHSETHSCLQLTNGYIDTCLVSMDLHPKCEPKDTFITTFFPLSLPLPFKPYPQKTHTDVLHICLCKLYTFLYNSRNGIVHYRTYLDYPSHDTVMSISSSPPPPKD